MKNSALAEKSQKPKSNLLPNMLLNAAIYRIVGDDLCSRLQCILKVRAETVHQNMGTVVLIFTNAVMIPGAKTSHAMDALLGNMSTLSFEMKILVYVKCYQRHHKHFVNYYLIPKVISN